MRAMPENEFDVTYGLIAVAACASKLSVFDASKNPSEIRGIRVHQRVPDILTRQIEAEKGPRKTEESSVGLEILGEAVEIINAADGTEEDAAPVRALAIAEGPIPRQPAGRLSCRRDDQILGLAGEKVLHVLDGAQEAVADDLGGLPGIVRRDDDVGQRQDGIVAGQRLLVEDIEPRAHDFPLFERAQESLAIDEGAAARIHEDGRGLHHGELLPAEEAPGLR